MDDSQDTKPVESSHTACRRDQTGALTDDTYTPSPLYPQATIGTQTNETKQPQTETLLEKETPPPPIETMKVGPDQPKDIRTKCKGWRRANLQTPDRPKPECEDNLWATLPFTEATWRPTYRVRAITSSDDVDPRVQEVLDLPVLDLATAQEEDPDLVFMKELLRDYTTRPPWNAVREESAEAKILWTQFHRLKVRENVLYRMRKETAASPQWQMVASKPLQSQIFKACHHHAMAANQGVMRTVALIKRHFYWSKVQKDVEAWCKRFTRCGCCKAAVRGHGKLQHPRHCAFNK